MLLQQRASSCTGGIRRDDGICSISGRHTSRRLALHAQHNVSSTAAPSRRRQHSLAASLQQQTEDGCSTSGQGQPPIMLEAALAAASSLAIALASSAPAFAAEELRYNPGEGETLIKTVSGVGYIVLLLFFLIRVLNRNARRAREERIAGQGPIVTPFTKLLQQKPELQQPGKATPFTAFLGAVQAAAIAFGLFIFVDKVETLIDAAPLPDQYTARNMAVTVRTIILGLLYLVTFIFSANAVGLGALSVQMLLFPDSIKDDDEDDAARAPKEPALPKVSVTSSPDEIRAAFDAVARAQSKLAQAGGAAAEGADQQQQQQQP